METLILPQIPETVTVHLGPPDSTAPNVTVGFAEYIKNVASNEIYPTWNEEAIKANVYAITTYVLNRIYTDYYPSRGYNFDITNSTSIDQAYKDGGEIFENISRIVDEQFNNYIVRENFVEPLFARFCNGTTSTCEGLSQWGSEALANEGMTALQILKRYYGDDIKIVSAPVGNTESYPGFPLRLGSAGNDVVTVQTELNRIARSYPAIPKIKEINGVFGVDTEAAVRKFQEIFNLSVDGIVGKATWYKLKRYYTGVKALSDTVSEGITVEEARRPYPNILREGMSGIEIRNLQYYLRILSFFNSNIPTVSMNGIFDAKTLDAVKKFQEIYGLNVTGTVGAATWKIIDKVYRESVAALPSDYNYPYAKYYPGYLLNEGMSGNYVEALQSYLSVIAEKTGNIPKIPVTGYFGEQTKNAVTEFQRQNGLEPTGLVGAVTWAQIAAQYDALLT